MTNRRTEGAIAYALYSIECCRAQKKQQLNTMLYITLIFSYLAVAARPLMLAHCLAASPTDTHSDVISGRQQHPVTSLLHSPTSLRGVSVVGDGVASPINSSSPESSARPWPTSPTDHRQGRLFEPADTWVRGSAESLVRHVRSLCSLSSVHNLSHSEATTTCLLTCGSLG